MRKRHWFKAFEIIQHMASYAFQKEMENSFRMEMEKKYQKEYVDIPSQQMDEIKRQERASNELKIQEAMQAFKVSEKDMIFFR